jgi:multidrug efflux system membrane fusion protein
MLFKPDLDTAKTAGKGVARSAGRRIVSIAIARDDPGLGYIGWTALQQKQAANNRGGLPATCRCRCWRRPRASRTSRSISTGRLVRALNNVIARAQVDGKLSQSISSRDRTSGRATSSARSIGHLQGAVRSGGRQKAQDEAQLANMRIDLARLSAIGRINAGSKQQADTSARRGRAAKRRSTPIRP